MSPPAASFSPVFAVPSRIAVLFAVVLGCAPSRTKASSDVLDPGAVTGAWRIEMHASVWARLLPASFWSTSLTKLLPERPFDGFIGCTIPSRLTARGEISFSYGGSADIDRTYLPIGRSDIQFATILREVPIGTSVGWEVLPENGIVFQVDPCCVESRITFYGHANGDTISGWWQQRTLDRVAETGSYIMTRVRTNPTAPGTRVR